MNHYTRLLNTTTTVRVNAENIQQQIALFSETVSKYVLATTKVLDDLHAKINCSEQQPLAEIKQILSKYNREMNHEFKKPVLNLQKQNARLVQTLTQRVMPFTAVKEEDMTSIKQEADYIAGLLQNNTSKIDVCLAAIKMCQNKIAQLYKTLSLLELPENILRTAKHIKMAINDMSFLNAKILQDVKARERYDDEFKELGITLEDFNSEASKIAIAPKVSC